MYIIQNYILFILEKKLESSKCIHTRTGKVEKFRSDFTVGYRQSFRLKWEHWGSEPETE